MKKFSSLMVVSFILSACSNEPAAYNGSSEQPMPASQVSASESPTITIPSMDLEYAAYRAAANDALRTAKTGLSIPETVVFADSNDGSKRGYHNFSDGLSVQISTTTDNKITEVRVVWNSDENKAKADKLLVAAAALIAATAPEDRTLQNDTSDQIKIAIQSHNDKHDPTRNFARGGVAYKVTVTNLPSVVLTASVKSI
ncbi:MAG: hypothetical protein E7I45_01165 [Eikenella corrodens]|uniref:hypothetical protein n=1 Tax=Eikenella corrodens TaxID=539 RepID=UPI00290DA25F|nr:hypothetical protein [Eikenella corrodens]MDU4299577.1 hypothetical protein [Eikenella corrodens]